MHGIWKGKATANASNLHAHFTVNIESTNLFVISKDLEVPVYAHISIQQVKDQFVYQSIINQSNFYSTDIPGEARLSGTTAKSVFNSKIEKTVP